MKITDKPEHDPVSDLRLTDAYMCWALMSAEEVVGKNGLAVVLRQIGLERLIGNYPPNQLRSTVGLTFGDYATINVGLLEFFGRAARSTALRIGRQSSRYAIEYQGALFGTAALIASKLLPSATQVKMGLTAAQLGLRRLSQAAGQDHRFALEDRGDRWAYVDYDDALSAGKLSDEPLGWAQTGALQETLLWQTGKEFAVQQVACRSMGHPASIWEVSKSPSQG